MADRLSAKDAFRVLSGNDPEQRETVIKSLWEIPGEEIAGLPLDTLLDALEDSHKHIRSIAAAALADKEI